MVLSPQRRCFLRGIRNEYVAPSSGLFKYHREILLQSYEALWLHGIRGGDGQLDRNDEVFCTHYDVEGGEHS